ncbi:FAD linked oxidase-like protein [Candidatus Koribacter versatilis Ellin345]|uniref:FAD linked oxidase-like protein n=1 Tax=Koribacter versatilis (strain Ellin345) TaxID=204669 RepID=Q1IMA8_KORVE|nr:FAD-binding and (Fe-S)-binding domain-containing protein [Candidatus Koribacter versatilis]ABF41992.1 FAD linked oxidase-like protein [Candidatus Koribacter versatilis Ellin345]
MSTDHLVSIIASDVDASRLEHRLRSTLAGEVRFDTSSRALYATDASNYRQIPIGVVLPKSDDDVRATLAACREFGAPVLARGGGTSLAGQCCNVAVVLDFSKYMNQILEINREGKYTRVQPGVVLDQLRNAATKVGLTFGPDPATHSRCTLGGMIGNNSCGMHSVMAGKTGDNVHELRVLTYDGLELTVGPTSREQLDQILAANDRRAEIYRSMQAIGDQYADLIRAKYPKIPRRVSGYNLDDLLPENNFHIARALVGSESTLVTVLEAKLRLIHNPEHRALVVLGYENIFAAADDVPELLHFNPIALEAIDGKLITAIRRKHLRHLNLDLLPEGSGFLIIEFGADSASEAAQQASALLAHVGSRAKARLYQHAAEQKTVWEIRESSLGATAFVPGEPQLWEGWEDAAVPPARMGEYLRRFQSLLDKFHYTGTLYGHFGQGCLHTRINFDLETESGVATYRAFVEEAADLVVSFGGSLSGEHGDGQSRAELLPKMYGPELIEAFRKFKQIWDPQWKMNPGKVVLPNRLDDNLRLGPHYHPWEPSTHFTFAADGGSFARASLRCVGVGECRRHENKVMCPSYRVTGEEQHSTRGRAHLLFEMMQGEIIRDGWQSEEVKESLDLCLSCKGCKSDCPVNVDVATYKAEFLSHYYEHRLRPRQAYAFGFIHDWARLASLAPGLVNLATQTPGLSSIAKLIAGIPQQRSIPAFAPKTFQQLVRDHQSRNLDAPKVLLWPDTFNNHFYPDTAVAALEVLESTGFQVIVPQADMCCGRPLYDHGFLAQAKLQLVKTMTTLAAEIDAGIPIVFLEPSCASVFRDELVNFFPDGPRAQRLKDQTYLLSDFLEKYAHKLPLPTLHRKVFAHAHCHHKAIVGVESEHKLFDRLGVDYELPNNGCCGMAGAFGFEAGEKYDVSIAVGEHELLPKVRSASRDTIIVAEGFSCREQIAQQTDRQALHPAELLHMAYHQGPEGEIGDPPESRIVEARQRAVRTSMLKSAAVLAGTLLGAYLLWRNLRD